MSRGSAKRFIWRDADSLGIDELERFPIDTVVKLAESDQSMELCRMNPGIFVRPCLHRKLSALLAAITVGLVGLSASGESSKPVKVNVEILAKGTSARSSWGGNQDTYLVKMTDPKTGSSEYAKLLDIYTVQGSIAPVSAKPKTSVSLKVRRTPECDVSLNQLLLRTPADSNYALLPIRFRFVFDRPEGLAENAQLSCYQRVLR